MPIGEANATHPEIDYCTEDMGRRWRANQRPHGTVGGIVACMVRLEAGSALGSGLVLASSEHRDENDGTIGEGQGRA